MRLKRVEVRNFRSIERASLTFEPRCRILLGKNEVGKTNLLAACALLDPAIKVAAHDLRETRADEDPVQNGHVRFIFGLTKDEGDQFAGEVAGRVVGADLPLCSNLGTRHTAQSFIKEFLELVQIVSIPDGKRLFTFWSKVHFKLESGWLVPKSGIDEGTNVYDVDGVERRIGDVLIAHSSRLNDQSHFEPAKIESVAHRYFELVKKISGDARPSCLFWTYSDTALLPATIDIESFKSNPSSCEPLRAMFLLAGERDPGRAIAQAQLRSHGLRNLLTRVAKATTAHVKKRWRELGNAEVVLAPNGAQIDASVRDAFNEFAFDRRSDGFKRFMSFLILVSARSSANDLNEVLFIQDEPDLALHPTGIRSLLDELIALSKTNYVLISTHSIFMVDKERIDRHVVVSKSEEVTSIATADRSNINDEEVLYNALGYSVYDLIRPNNLIFEGWRDKRLFSLALKKKGVAYKFLRDRMKSELGLAHAMGVRDIPKVVMYFNAIGRKSFVVTDGDDVARERQTVFCRENPDTPWHRYDELDGNERACTAEDYISPAKLRSAFVKALNAAGVLAAVPRDFFQDRGVGGVKAADQFLVANDVQAQARKEILNGWKSELFANLDISDITESYDGVIAGIAKLMGFEVGSVHSDEPVAASA